LLCGLASALAAAAITHSVLNRNLRDAVFKTVSDANCILVRDITCKTTMRTEDGRVFFNQSISTSGSEASALFVEHWLDSRNLVMAPKGHDFGMKVKAP
jgi:hypothetical protein